MKTNYLKEKKEIISFEEYIINLMNDKYPSNIHHNKQYSFLVKYNKKIDYIKMENFRKKKNRFNKKYNLNFNLIEKKGENNKRKKDETVKKFVGKTNWENIKLNYPYDYRHFYNHDLKLRVYHIYRDDFQTFNYTWKDFIENQ